MNLCLIPARAGSKRIPNKNIKPFFGKPIIEYSIELAKLSGLFDKIVISTDYNTELDKYESIEVSVQKRPKLISDDKATIFDVFRHVIRSNQGYDKCCILYATSPLATVSQLVEGYVKLENNPVIYPIVKYSQPPNKDLFLVKEKNNCILMPKLNHDDYEGMENRYYHAGAWFWCNVDKCMKSKKIVQMTGDYVELRDYEAQDINTPEDWDLAEEKYKLKYGDNL